MTEWARLQGLHPQTAYRWFREGKLPVPAVRAGSRPVPDVQAVAGHRDRLGRVNTELAGAALSAHGRRLVVLDPGEVDDDLVRDMTQVLMSFCARRYGRRLALARTRAQKALRCARRDVGPASPGVTR